MAWNEVKTQHDIEDETNNNDEDRFTDDKEELKWIKIISQSEIEYIHKNMMKEIGYMVMITIVLMKDIIEEKFKQMKTV